MVSTTATLVLLLAAVGVTLAYTYVAPDDQMEKTGPRVQAENPGRPRRQKPQPMTAQQAAQASAPRVRRGGLRLTRGVDSNSGSFSSSGSGSGSFGGGSGAGGNQVGGFHNPGNVGFYPMDFGSFFQYVQDMQNAFQQNANNQGFSGGFGGNGNNNNGGGHGNNGGGYGNNGGGYGNNVGNEGGGSSAVASIGPQGGYGSANVNPDLGNRFGGGDDSQSGQFPAPSGGNYGVFTSSSSGSSDVNGQRQHFQQATSGVNDNGKITSFTVNKP